MGGIYLITNQINGKQYVDQTCGNFVTRWKNHEHAAEQYKKYANGEISKCKNKGRLYVAMNKYGVKNFIFEIIADQVLDSDLDDCEIAYIKFYNTISPYGYNLTSGGGHFRHNDETKKLISELAILAAPFHIDKYRKEETRGLPMYIVSHYKGNARGFAICGHPLCSYKSFTLRNYDTMDDCKAAACEFLEELVKNGVKHEFEKANPELPRGITAFRNGFLAKRKTGGIMYKKTFEGKNIPDHIKLANAIEYLNSIPK